MDELRTHGIATVKATRHIRRMQGGAQSHLLHCSDGYDYIVKFQNNPQGRRILANDLLGTMLAKSMKLPVPDVAIVEVSKDLILACAALQMECSQASEPCQAGLCFGSRYLSPRFHITHGTGLARSLNMSTWYLRNLSNLKDFAGMLVFDKWTCNTDDRQVVFVRGRGVFPDKAVMIDCGYCFNAGHWNFRDHPMIGLFGEPYVYKSIERMEQFNPWLEFLEHDMSESLMVLLASKIPSEWYSDDRDALTNLIGCLDERRKIVRRLLSHTCAAARQSFPRWRIDLGRVHLSCPPTMNQPFGSRGRIAELLPDIKSDFDIR